MAKTRIFSSLFDCLITLLVLCAFTTGCAATIHTDQHAIGWFGQDVRLPCDFTYPDVLALYWKNNSGTTKVSFFRENPFSFDDRFTMNDDFSLVIRDVQVSDDGRYSCHLELDSGQSFTNHTELSIYASPSIPHIEQCPNEPPENNIFNMHSICTVETSNTRPFNLDCRVTGFRPNVTLEWTSLGIVKKPIGEPFQRELPDGTWEREVSLSVTAKLDEEQNYTCKVRGEATNGSAWSTTATVRVQEEAVRSGLPTRAMVVIFIGVIGAVFVLGILVVAVLKILVRLRRQRKLPRKGGSKESSSISVAMADAWASPRIDGSFRCTLSPGMYRPHDVICHQGNYIVTDTYYNRIIYVKLDSSSDVLCDKRQGSVSADMRPYGIVALSDSKLEFLFTDMANRCILRYADGVCKIWSQVKQNGRPTGITIDSTGHVYVADCENHCIQVYDENGRFCSSFGSDHLKMPWFLKFNSKDHLFVADDKEGVKIFERDGQFVMTLMVRPENRSWSCRGITIDQFDNIFVTARTTHSLRLLSRECVAIYDPTCNPISSFGGLMYFNFVRGICCDYGNNNLVVVDGERHCLQLYKLYDQQPQTIASAADDHDESDPLQQKR